MTMDGKSSEKPGPDQHPRPVRDLFALLRESYGSAKDTGLPGQDNPRRRDGGPEKDAPVEQTQRLAGPADLGWIVAISFGINILMLTSPLYMLQIYDRVVSSGSYDTLVYLSLACGGLLLANGLLEGFRSQLTNNLAAKYQLAWAPKLLRSLARIQFPQKETPAPRPLQDLDIVQKFISGNVITALLDAPWTPIFLFVLFVLHPLLGLTAVAGAILLTAIALVTELCTKKLTAEAYGKSGTAQAYADDIVANAGVVRSMGMLSVLQARWHDAFESAARIQSTAADRASFLKGMTKFVRPLLQMGILGFGAYLVIDGKMSAGAMVAGSILMGRALAPIEQVVSGWRSLLQARAARTRLNGFIEKHVHKENETISYPAPEGRLDVEGASVFIPGTATPILNKVSLSLNPGESVAVVGQSGAGKSTLARLIAGAQCPDKGAVRLDGVEMAHWPEDQRLTGVGYLPQDVQLFAGSVAQNISRFTEGRDADVHTAAALAGADDVIKRLSDGFLTQLSADGTPLSPGSRQRVALARALFGAPPLVVLDEPDAHLDSEGEAALSRALEQLKERGVTVVIVTHRSSILHHVDKILAIEAGRVSFFGEKEKFLTRLSAVA